MQGPGTSPWGMLLKHRVWVCFSLDSGETPPRRSEPPDMPMILASHFFPLFLPLKETDWGLGNLERALGWQIRVSLYAVSLAIGKEEVEGKWEGLAWMWMPADILGCSLEPGSDVLT